MAVRSVCLAGFPIKLKINVFSFQIRLASVLDELRNVVGDQYSDAELIKTTIAHNFNCEAALDALLNKTSAVESPTSNASATSSSSNFMPQREKKQRKRGTIDANLFR